MYKSLKYNYFKKIIFKIKNIGILTIFIYDFINNFR